MQVTCRTSLCVLVVVPMRVMVMMLAEDILIRVGMDVAHTDAEQGTRRTCHTRRSTEEVPAADFSIEQILRELLSPFGPFLPRLVGVGTIELRDRSHVLRP